MIVEDLKGGIEGGVSCMAKDFGEWGPTEKISESSPDKIVRIDGC